MTTATQSPELPAARKQRKPNPPAPKPATEIRCEILKPDHYAEWDNLVDASPHGTVFHYAWWLQAAAREFEILGVRNGRGVLEGGMPVSFRRRRGFRLVRSPEFTRYLGPIFDVSSATTTCDRLHLMRSVGEILARGVKPFDSFHCLASPHAPDLQGFLWAGFDVRLSYAFRFPVGRVAGELAPPTAQPQLHQLREASHLAYTLSREIDLDEIDTLTRSRSKFALSIIPTSALKRIWNSARSRNRGQIYVARDGNREPVAALLTVNDGHTTYELLSLEAAGQSEKLPLQLVLEAALQDCQQDGRDFEFQTTSFRHNDGFYRRWGAVAVPIPCIEKAGSWRGGLLHSWADRRNALSAFR